MLHRYWLTFIPSSKPSILNIGCGITAYNIEDAKHIFRCDVVPVYGAREIRDIIQDIDVSTLDENHVKPNMAAPTKRGVWFPLLSSQIV